ncbi:hypothetical protein OE88DRAFT_600082 [Heliocybe sulcata]|uniref:Homeobox domain-containing protein n=1 Tax=Heliocybe sulcata TaxID=5364 RepID=A0A5C3MTH5_9AGAM|nr:hypothetical protein OE88DRAFT_600082 [Heliocybe sulcata]
MASPSPSPSTLDSRKEKAAPFRIPAEVRHRLLPRLSRPVLKELKAIWSADPRVPTVSSRQAWALSRGVEPNRVHTWFSNKKRADEKMGTLKEGTYELGLDPVRPSDDATEEKENIEPLAKREIWRDTAVAIARTVRIFGDCYRSLPEFRPDSA